MVYGRLIYNNVKDYTPQWFKTIPYQQTVKPSFVRKPQVVSRLNADPKVKAFWTFLGRNVADNPWAWQVYIFVNSFVIFSLCYYPWLWVYQQCRLDLKFKHFLIYFLILLKLITYQFLLYSNDIAQFVYMYIKNDKQFLNVQTLFHFNYVESMIKKCLLILNRLILKIIWQQQDI